MAVIGNSYTYKLDHLRTLENNISQDNLEGNFIRIFAPFQIVQKCLGSCRVDVKDGLVTAPTTSQKFYSVVYVGLSICSTISLSQTYFAKKIVTDRSMKALFLSGVVVICLMNFLNVLHTRFLNNEGNVKLHVKMQTIDLVMRINRLNSMYSMQYKLNLKAVLILITGFILLSLVTLWLTWGQFNVTHLFGPISNTLTFTIEAACCCSHITFFANRMRLINFIIKNHLQKEIRKISLSMQCNTFKSLRKIATEWQDFESSETDIYIEEIFSGFSAFQELYEFQVLIFCTSFIFWFILPFEYCIVALQKNINLQILIVDFIHIFTQLYIQVSLLLALCIHTEFFFHEVKETKNLSVVVMSRYIDGPLRQKAKHMLKLIEDVPPFFSVYGMFHVNASLLLKMFSLVTSLLVTIVQLAYL